MAIAQTASTSGKRLRFSDTSQQRPRISATPEQGLDVLGEGRSRQEDLK